MTDAGPRMARGAIPASVPAFHSAKVWSATGCHRQERRVSVGAPSEVGPPSA